MKSSPVAHVFSREWHPLVATLVRDLGDLALAEDCAQDAFVEAAERWKPPDLPTRPGAWLLTTARRKAIDRVRRDNRFTDRLPTLHQMVSAPTDAPQAVADDQLALIFGCCHPSLAREAQVALTLREVCGLSTTQIAAAFLVAEPTMAKRLVRAKDKIRSAGVPFTVPPPASLGDRLASVLHVIYLIFTEGHTSADPTTLVRGDLCDEARWLAALLSELVPDEPEAAGLSALLCFSDARRATRVDTAGRLILLEEQDRSRWDRALHREGEAHLRRALDQHSVGAYQLQAMIAAQHLRAPSNEETDWAAIVTLYNLLLAIEPAPVVALNRAVAVAMAEGPAAGLELLDEMEQSGNLRGYRYLPAARADLLRRLGRGSEAAEAYRTALELTSNDAERGFLLRRLAELRELRG